MAEVLEEFGFYVVLELICYGGSYDQGGSGSGFKVYWY